MPKLGYLLPTRERVMENHHETGSLLALAEKGIAELVVLQKQSLQK